MGDQKDIIRYYQQTRWDYRWVWGTRFTHAIHFGFYDERATNHAAAVDNMNRVLADQVQIRAGEQVLDAGCGVGGSSIWLVLHRQCRVTGITLVDSQVADAKKNALMRGAESGLTFMQGDYLRSPFPDESFDVVWALESLCHSQDKSDFYREAFRLLRPGGRLTMAEYIRGHRSLEKEEEERLRKWLHNWAIPDIDTADEHRFHAEAAGFRDFTCMDETIHTRQSLRNSYVHAKRWYTTARFLYHLGLVSDVQVKNVQGTIRQYEAMESGNWYYGLIKAVK